MKIQGLFISMYDKIHYKLKKIKKNENTCKENTWIIEFSHITHSSTYFYLLNIYL